MNILHAQYTLRAKELEAKYAARGQSGVGSSIFTPGVGEVPAIANTKVAEAAHEAVVNADRVANNALRKGLDVGVPKDVIPKVARDLATILKFGDLNQLDPQYKVQQSPWSGSGMPPQQYRVDRPEWTANPAAIASKIVGLVHANASTEVKKLATSILTEDLSGKIEAIGGWGKFKDLPAAQKEAMITQALSDLNDSTKSGYTSLDSSAFNTAFSNTVTSAGNTTVARAQVAKNFAEIDKSVLSRSPDTFNGGADGAKILSKYVTDESVIGDVNGAGGAKYSVKGHFVQKLGRALNGAEIAHLTTAVNATGRIKNGLIEVLVKPGTGDADSIDGGVFYIEPEGAVGQQVTMYGILNQNRTNFVKGDGYKHVTVPD
jgi:hypothetical protein